MGRIPCHRGLGGLGGRLSPLISREFAARFRRFGRFRENPRMLVYRRLIPCRRLATSTRSLIRRFRPLPPSSSSRSHLPVGDYGLHARSAKTAGTRASKCEKSAMRTNCEGQRREPLKERKRQKCRLPSAATYLLPPFAIRVYHFRNGAAAAAA